MRAVGGVLAMAEPVETHFMWRPQLRDPADELVLDGDQWPGGGDRHLQPGGISVLRLPGSASSC